ncbi:MAG: hypothetical protein WC773_01470 [Patescibacteria group bacterium]|jgi:ABC-type cobalamin/Fe3+-siderophores transport system ATPase subunit
MRNNPRGSIWARWDLHVHTKDTAKNDRFTSQSFGQFCTTLLREALSKEIVVIGITDYFNIDNYKKVKEFVDNIDSFHETNESGEPVFLPEEKVKIKEIFIIPNIELRMMPSTDHGRLVNIHCILNPDFVANIDNDLFNSIEYAAEPGRKFKMNQAGFIGLGKFIDSNLSDVAAYKKGIDSFVVDHSQLHALYEANANFREKVIIVVSNSCVDGASGLQKHYDLFENDAASQLDAVRKSIYTISNAIFSGNPEDRRYFLGEKTDDRETVISKCGSLKPCVHGCDAHTEAKLFNPDNNLFCWIKADTSFEGLKQVLWEPKDRVRIQERNPGDSKSGRIIIDRATYKNADQQDKTVVFNQDLNSIIGVRGSGKSTLLRNIAHNVDPAQFTEKDKPANLYPLDSVKVIWVDGQEDHGSNDSPKSVFYIPQNYLSSLAYDDGDKAAERDQFLTRLLKKHSLFANAIQVYEELTSNNKVKAEALIESLLSAKSTNNETALLIRKQGSKIEIEKEIANKNVEIKKYKVSGSTSISDEEIKEYSDAKSLIADNQKFLLLLSQDKTILETLDKTGAGVYVSNQEFSRLSLERQKLIRDELVRKGKESLSVLIKAEIDSIKTEINSCETVIKENSAIVSTLNEKIKLNTALETLTKELAGLQDTIKKIDELTKILQQSDVQQKEAIDSLINIYKEYDYQRKTVFETVRFDDLFTFLNIDIVTEYNSEDLKRFVERNINTRDTDASLKQEPDITQFFGESTAQLSNDTLRKVIVNLVNNKIKIKVDASDVSQVISQLIKNRYEIDYLNSVKTKENDTAFKDMTGGQKAIALLELVFRFDDEKYPILIDQPEDDLDVGGVATDLVNFIKSEKEDRQIIIVSHNGSLVVCADSEEVLVSSNSRHSAGKYNFDYLTGSIENIEIRDRIIDVLEGGKEALRQRARKLDFKKEL